MAQLADYLLANRLVSPNDLETAAAESHASGRTLGQVLVDLGILPESTLVKFVASQLGMPFYELADVSVDGSAIALVPEGMCRRYALMPVGFSGEALRIAMADPSNVVALDDLRSTTGREIKVGVATRVTSSPPSTATIDRRAN